MAMLTRLRQMLKILKILHRVKVETGVGYLAALAWFRTEPLAGFDGMTADRLVREGHADYVHAYLDDVADGGYA